MDLVTYPDRDLMMLALADRVASDLAEALRHHDRVSFAVPGGTTPGPVFDVLAAQALDWDRVTVMLTDERWVAPDSPRSNTGLVQQRLLVSKASAAMFIPYFNGAAAPEAALDALSAAVAPHLPLSVLLLGMGADMHVASLFPDADRLAAALAADAPPVLAMRAPGAGEPRVTLTAPVLRGAMTTHLVITGADKRAALERAAGLPEAEAPVRCVLGQAMVHWAE